MSDGLNPEQQQAADHRQGPLMITAGPGSGKTRVIVGRALSLIEAGVAQQSILCLTFTNKATGEMQERLEERGKLDVKVSTFHAFTREILLENLAESGVGRETRIFGKWAQVVWCMRNTDKFGFDPEYVDIGGSTKEIYAGMLEAIRSLKDEMISPQRLQEYVDEQLGAPEPQNPELIHKLGELGKVYRAYEEYKAERNLIDFDDMVAKTVELFRGNAALLAKYQERYQYVMIDEFQDNNYAQLELARLLAGHKNIGVVGDEDQSIMGFQGSHSGIFQEYKKMYPELEEVRLVKNYRSTGNIIRIADQVLGRDTEGRRQQKPDGDKIAVVCTPTENGQMEFVVQTIRQLIKEGMRYQDIAILSRRRADGHIFARALESFGIPASIEMGPDIRRNPAVAELVAYLKIAHSSGTAGMMIFDLLRKWGIAERNIMVLMNQAHRKARDAGDESQDLVWETVRDCDKLAITQKQEISELAQLLDGIIRLAADSSVSDLVYHVIMKQPGLYKRVLQSGPQDRTSAMLLSKIHKIAEEYDEVFPDRSLGGFLNAISTLDGLGIELEDSAPADAVNVLTMHKSKGKEFPVVFVTDMAKNRFPLRYREKPFRIPKELLQGESRMEDTKEMHDEEERRLFYVAITRTMERLYMIQPIRYGKNVRDTNPSRFLVELDYKRNPLIKVTDFDESEDFDVQPASRVERTKSDKQRQIHIAIGQPSLKTAIHRIVELSRIQHYERFGNFDGFDPRSILDVDMGDVDLSAEVADKSRPLFNHDELTLSASSIKAYEKCPLQFKFEKIDRVPRPSSIPASLGRVIHAVVEEVAKERSQGRSVTPEDGMKRFAKMWSPGMQSRAGEERITDRADTMIRTYLEWEERSENELVDTEIPFSILIDDVKFNGRIDRLERNPGGRYEVVDFKSGKGVLSRPKAAGDPQLNIYAKAVEKLKGELPAKVSLFYLESGKVVEYAVTKGSVDAATESIKEMIAKILSENFEPTPSYGVCNWCDYQSICDAKAV